MSGARARLKSYFMHSMHITHANTVHMSHQRGTLRDVCMTSYSISVTISGFYNGRVAVPPIDRDRKEIGKGQERDWKGMGWDGMDGMGWDGMGWDGMGWDGMGWDGMGWDGMEWDGMGSGCGERDGVGWDGVGVGLGRVWGGCWVGWE